MEDTAVASTVAATRRRPRPPRVSILDGIIQRGGVPTPLELQFMLGMIEQQRVTNLSPDAVKRSYASYVKQVAPNRLAISLGDALKIASGEATPHPHAKQAPKGSKAKKFFDRVPVKHGTAHK